VKKTITSIEERGVKLKISQFKTCSSKNRDRVAIQRTTHPDQKGSLK